ncbi:hypothetical protein CUJ86_04055 [Methanofollis fontis]|uniref:PAS domain-containing protein n=2 Tax=Methanofollis fontis TaxID=2052832 RepID=A0A483CN57_9EURY|nr:hypothetical protein CUJ86_04055 [Methanofollis fontis]
MNRPMTNDPDHQQQELPEPLTALDSRTPLCILEALPFPVIALSGNNDLLYLNTVAATLFGIEPLDSVGGQLEDFFSPGVSLALKKHARRSADFAVPSRGMIQHAYRDYDVYAAPLRCSRENTGTVIMLHPVQGQTGKTELSLHPCPDGSGCWVPIFVPNFQ